MDQFYAQLSQVIGSDQVREKEPMRDHTSFQIGGPADYFVIPRNSKELADIILTCKNEQIPYYVLGNGSNLLVGDKGYRGVIISMGEGFDFCKIEGELITAGAGILLTKLAMNIAKETLSGFEFASGIPGSLGGAVVMNAGAYGAEIKDVLVSATVLTEDGKTAVLTNKELNLGYRFSCIPQNHYTVLEAALKLKTGNSKDIYDKMEELTRQRKANQPLEYPSAGSTFKRPQGYYAGKLITDAGLGGYQVGGAQISLKHKGFVINTGDASAADVMQLIREVQLRIKEKFGVEIEMEVKILGSF